MSGINRIIQAVERMPAFPKSVHQVLLLTSDINCPQKELVEVIKKDPVFTLKILKLVNSAFFGLVREVTSINQASVYLGLNTLKNVALGLAAIGTFPKKNPAGLDMNGFWLHSLSVATGAKMLGELLRVSHDEAGDLFAAGLLHDMGKLVFALYLSEEFSRALAEARDTELPLFLSEARIFGQDHASVGAILADKWHLPKNLSACIAGHHAPDKVKGDLLADCVFASNQIGKKLGYGFSGDRTVCDLPERIKNRFSLDLDGLVASLPDLDEEVEKAKVFIRLGEAAQ